MLLEKRCQNPIITSEVKDIFVSDGKVIIGGVEDKLITDYIIQVGCYWVDGVKHELMYGESGDIHYSGSLNSMYVINNDVYAVGRDNDPLNFKSLIWKNGVKEELLINDINVSNPQLLSIVVVDEDVYISGNYYNVNLEFQTACYWKNGVRNDLSGNNAIASTIFIISK